MISPTVAQHQQPSAHTSREAAYRKQFTEAAFSILRAKYPEVTQYVITFKILDDNIEDRTGLATFILRYGKDVLYLPVAMSAGSIESCELVYSKSEDSFEPLVKSVIDRIKAKNTLEEPDLVEEKDYFVNDTRDLFKRLKYPPASSSVVMAGGQVTIDSLPNASKAKIAAYLENTPTILQKIAEFYPVELLGRKLAAVEHVHEPTADIPEVISLEEVTKEAAQKLSAEQKAELLDVGFTYTSKVPEEDKPKVLSVNQLPFDVLSKLSAIELDNCTQREGVGYAVVFGKGGSLEFKKALVLRDTVILDNQVVGLRYPDKKVIICGLQEGLSAEDLKSFGATLAKDIKTESKTKSSRFFKVFFPTRSGVFTDLDAPRIVDPSGSIYASRRVAVSSAAGDSIIKEVSSEGVTLRNFGRHFGRSNSLVFSDTISAGAVRMEHTKVIPAESLCLVIYHNSSDPKPALVRSLSDLVKGLQMLGTKLSLRENGAGLTLFNKSNKTSVEFAKEAELATHLGKKYKFGSAELSLLKESKDILVLDKTAFMVQPTEQVPEIQDTPATAPVFSQPGEAQQLEGFNPEVIEAAADLGDQDILDTGILASVAGEEDIHSVLVDMLPHFMDVNSRLGRTILSLVLQKEKLQEFYGDEAYSTLLANIRKVFKMLGEISSKLKKFVNMQ